MSDREINIEAIKRNSNDFKFVDTLGSFINNIQFKRGYDDYSTGRRNQHSYLWNVLSAIGEDYAETIYENILNYIDNVSNVDLCKIKALQSMLKIVGLEYDILDSFSTIPVEIANLMDILSINRSYLLHSDKFSNEFINELDAENCIKSCNLSAHSIPISEEVLSSTKVTVDNRYIDEDQYHMFLQKTYLKILYKYVYLKYADSENALPSDKEFIYQYIQNDILRQQKASSKTTFTAYQAEMHNLKLKYGLPPSFDSAKIVDNIENGYDSVDNYTIYEQQVIKEEILFREQSYSSLKKYTNQVEKFLGYNLTRYSYYREKKVREYFSYIENTCNNLILDSTIESALDRNDPVSISRYDKDVNYFDINQPSNESLLKYEQSLQDVVVQNDMILKIAQLLADQTIQIANIRDQIKTQIRKSYMRGTFLLISYVINEFLKYGIQDKYGKYFTTREGVSLSTILQSSLETDDNVQLIEYYDDTEYYNITTPNDKHALNGETTTEKFWDNFYDKIGKNSQDIPLDQIEDFYLNQLKLKDKQVDNVVNFLSILYEYGANNSYINCNTEEFTCQLNDGRYIGDPNVEIKRINNETLSIDTITDAINTYIECGYQQVVDEISDQLSSLSTFVSSYYWNEISDANESHKEELFSSYDESLDKFNEIGDKILEISTSYDELKTDPKYYEYYLTDYDDYSTDTTNRPYLIEKLAIFANSCENDDGITWRYQRLSNDLVYLIGQYNSLSSDLYNRLFELSVWTQGTNSEGLNFEYWPYYSPKYDDELTTVTDTLKDYLVSQAQVQNDDAMQHLQNHYDKLLSYKNEIHNKTAENLPQLVELINAELSCLKYSPIVCSSSTEDSVVDDANRVYDELVMQINDLTEHIHAGSEPNGWRSLDDDNLYPFKQRLNRIKNINLSSSSPYNIQWINNKFNEINLSVNNILFNDSKYFTGYSHNATDRLDKQIQSLSSFMITRDEQSKNDVIKSLSELCAQHNEQLNEFNMLMPTIMKEHVNGINSDYSYQVSNTLYTNDIYDKVKNVDSPYGPIRYKDCVDYLICGDYINTYHTEKLSGIIHWISSAYDEFESTTSNRIHVAIPGLKEYIDMIDLINISQTKYLYNDMSSTMLLLDKFQEIKDGLNADIEYISAQMPQYFAQKEIYLKYNGTHIGYDPFYNHKNLAYSSYQIHPYLYNFIEKSNIVYPLANNFFLAFSETYEQDLYNKTIDSIIGKYGNIKDLWKSGMFDWTSYQSLQEKHGSQQAEKNPMVGFNGLFYPPALEAFLTDPETFIQDVQDDVISSYYHHLNLNIASSNRIAEQLTSYVDAIRQLAQWTGDGSSVVNASLSNEYDIYKYAEDSNGNSIFLLKSYKYLYEDHRDEVGYSPSYNEKKNTLGEVWMRIKDHPLAFPAFDIRPGCSMISQYNIEETINSDGKKINDYILSLNEYFENYPDNDVKDYCKDLPSRYNDWGGTQYLRCFFDFELDPTRRSLLLSVPYKTGTNHYTTMKDIVYESPLQFRYANSSIVVGVLEDAGLDTSGVHIFNFCSDSYSKDGININVDNIYNTNMYIPNIRGTTISEFVGFAVYDIYVYAIYVEKHGLDTSGDILRNPYHSFRVTTKSGNIPYLTLRYASYKVHSQPIYSYVTSEPLKYDIYNVERDRNDILNYDSVRYSYKNASNVVLAASNNRLTIGFLTERISPRNSRDNTYIRSSTIVNFAEYSAMNERYTVTDESGLDKNYPTSTALIQTTDSDHINIYNSFDSFTQHLVNVVFTISGSKLRYKSTSYFNLNSDIGYLPQYPDTFGKTNLNSNPALKNMDEYSIELLGPEKSDIPFTPVIKDNTDEKYGRVVEEYKEYNKIESYNTQLSIYEYAPYVPYEFNLSSVFPADDWSVLTATPDLLRYKYILYNTKYEAQPILKGNLSDDLPNGYYYQWEEKYDLLSGEEILGPNQTSYQNVAMTNHIDNISEIPISVIFDPDTLLPTKVCMSCIVRIPSKNIQTIPENTFRLFIYSKNNVKSYEYYHLFENSSKNAIDQSVTYDEEWLINFNEISSLNDYVIPGTDKKPFEKHTTLLSANPRNLSAMLEFKYSEEETINREFPYLDASDVEDEITIVQNDTQSIYFTSLDDHTTIDRPLINIQVYDPNHKRYVLRKINTALPKYDEFYDRALRIETTYNMEKSSTDETRYEAVLYFNYKNFTNPSYINFSQNGSDAPLAVIHNSIDPEIQTTFLVLKPGQTGVLDIRIDYAYYGLLNATDISESILGHAYQIVKRYYVMNTSDDKPKFIISRHPFGSLDVTEDTGHYELEDQYQEGMAFRYIRFIIESNRSASSGSVLSKRVAIGQIQFINPKTGNPFEFPSNTTATVLGGTIIHPNGPLRMLTDNKTEYFSASDIDFSTSALEIIFDLRSACLDIDAYSTWKWYTSPYSKSHNGYIPKKFRIEFSNDNYHWYTADEFNDMGLTITTNNYNCAYVGSLDPSRYAIY